MYSSEMAAVRAFIGAINQGNVAELSNLMAEDFVFVNSGGESEAGRAEAWVGFFHMFPDYKMKVEKMIQDQNVVAVFGSVCGTYNGNRGLVPENKIAMPAAWRDIVVHGKVKHWQVYANWTEGWKVINDDKNHG